MRELYEQIFKRKSFHLFRGVGNASISQEELQQIKERFDSCQRLYQEIRTALRIVPGKDVQKKDAEYCLLLYSEKKENYLMNIGYMGQQLDLFLSQKNIGSLWCGLGKPDQKTYDGLDYVIMFCIHKVEDVSLFRKDVTKAKRKPLSETWEGDTLGVAEVAMYAPSACNSQPWMVKNTGDALEVTRYQKEGMVGLMPMKAAYYFNRIDIGIYLCILEICLEEKGIPFDRTLFADETMQKYSLVAKYLLRKA